MAGNRSRTIATGASPMRAGKVCDVVAYARRPGGIAKADVDRFDETLFERLRALRRRLADERGVPAYIIFSDVSLREMARTYPANSTEFRRISGVGEQKLKDFGDAFLREIKSHLAAHPRRTFSEDGDVRGLKRHS